METHAPQSFPTLKLRGCVWQFLLLFENRQSKKHANMISWVCGGDKVCFFFFTQLILSLFVWTTKSNTMNVFKERLSFHPTFECLDDTLCKLVCCKLSEPFSTLLQSKCNEVFYLERTFREWHCIESWQNLRPGSPFWLNDPASTSFCKMLLQRHPPPSLIEKNKEVAFFETMLLSVWTQLKCFNGGSS